MYSGFFSSIFTCIPSIVICKTTRKASARMPPGKNLPQTATSSEYDQVDWQSKNYRVWSRRTLVDPTAARAASSLSNSMNANVALSFCACGLELRVSIQYLRKDSLTLLTTFHGTCSANTGLTVEAAPTVQGKCSVEHHAAHKQVGCAASLSTYLQVYAAHAVAQGPEARELLRQALRRDVLRQVLHENALRQRLIVVYVRVRRIRPCEGGRSKRGQERNRHRISCR